MTDALKPGDPNYIPPPPDSSQDAIPSPSLPPSLADVTYDVVMVGTYKGVAEGTNTVVQKPYRVETTMPHAMVDKHGVLSTWKSYQAEEIMPHLYPDFQILVEYRIEGDAKCSNPELVQQNIQLLGLPSLKLYVKTKNLPINTVLYSNAEDLRRAIVNQQNDPAGYKVTEQILASTHGDAAIAKSKLKDLNQDIIAKNRAIREGSIPTQLPNNQTADMFNKSLPPTTKDKPKKEI